MNKPAAHAKTKERKSSSKKKAQSIPASQMRSFRFRRETIELLQELTKTVNQNTNIKVSSTAILEMLIQNAAKSDINHVLRLMHVNKIKSE